MSDPEAVLSVVKSIVTKNLVDERYQISDAIMAACADCEDVDDKIVNTAVAAVSVSVDLTTKYLVALMCALDIIDVSSLQAFPEAALHQKIRSQLRVIDGQKGEDESP